MPRVLLGAMLLAFAVVADAQERISERDYLAVLRGDHPGLAIVDERVGIARAERVRAGLFSNPVTSFEREAPGSVEQTTWKLAWSPPFDLRRGAASRAAAAGLRAATARSRIDRSMLRSELRQAYADWAISAERRQVVEAHLAMVRRLAEQMEARAARGEDSQLAARRLSLALLEVEAEAAHSDATAIRAARLAKAWNDRVSPSAVPERPSLPEPVDSLLVIERPHVVSLKAEVEQAEWQLRHSRRFLRFPEVAIGWQTIRDDPFEDEGMVLSASWEFPFFDRQQPDRIQAGARLAGARGRLRLGEARSSAEWSSTREVYARLRRSAIRGIETARQGDRVIESASATFRLGESRLTDLLETLRSALSAQLAALDLYAAALEAHRALELAAGQPLSPEE